jgi:hypothetical protein
VKLQPYEQHSNWSYCKLDPPTFHVFQLKPFMTNNTPMYAELQTFASSMEPEAVPEAII